MTTMKKNNLWMLGAFLFCIVLTGLGACTESNDNPVSPGGYGGGGDIDYDINKGSIRQINNNNIKSEYTNLIKHVTYIINIFNIPI